MKYANTFINNAGVEVVITVLPLSAVPFFDPKSPPQENTYGVPDYVQVGWAKQPDGSFAPYEAPKAVPKSVTMGQTRLALFDKGYLSTVETALAAMPGVEGDRARLEWKTRPTVVRSSPLVATMGALLGLTADQLDDLFIYADTL